MGVAVCWYLKLAIGGREASDSDSFLRLLLVRMTCCIFVGFLIFFVGCFLLGAFSLLSCFYCRCRSMNGFCMACLILRQLFLSFFQLKTCGQAGAWLQLVGYLQTPVR